MKFRVTFVITMGFFFSIQQGLSKVPLLFCFRLYSTSTNAVTLCLTMNRPAFLLNSLKRGWRGIKKEEEEHEGYETKRMKDTYKRDLVVGHSALIGYEAIARFPIA
ncbi:hypothetical protein F4775DRAFT_543725 [Biscogniauxia sp. FL1348]|nr:hypothetical protein F4775DRAFT_543725 [Biscogniauxia sp. FL1348]